MKTKAIKTKILKDILSKTENAKVLAVVGFEGLPSVQFQEIRKSLREDATVLVTKNSLTKIMLEELKQKKPHISDLEPYLKGQTAIIYSSKINAFKLAMSLEKSKKKAPAKGGEIAEEDIIVPAGETSFKPGPVVGEMQKVGIPAAIDKGKVVIKKDAVVVKKGNVIPKDLAQMLSRLSIYPVTVGLDIRSAWEDGYVFKKESLLIDSEMVIKDLVQAIRSSMILAVEKEYFTKETAPLIVSKAARVGLALSLEIGYPTKENISLLIQKAYKVGLSLNNVVKKE